jgi:hypothetical protein
MPTRHPHSGRRVSLGLAIAAAIVAVAVLAGFVFRARPEALVFAAQTQPAAQPVRQPVLVELFTSEGCSSCPPADALLAQIDEQQPIPGAQVIALSEHVTYWNGEGWHDPFSSESATNRQNEYSAQFGLNTVYTPQMVIDGAREAVGSNRTAVAQAITSSAQAAKVPITIENAHWSRPDNSVPGKPGDIFSAEISSGAFPRAVVMVALADDSDRSSVLHGENGGRELRHVAVVRSLAELRKTAGPLQNLAVQIKLPNGIQPQSKMRFIVFLTDPHTGRVLGAAMQTINQ